MQICTSARRGGKNGTDLLFEKTSFGWLAAESLNEQRVSFLMKRVEGKESIDYYGTLMVSDTFATFSIFRNSIPGMIVYMRLDIFYPFICLFVRFVSLFYFLQI